jgi:peptidoglycan/LPS O-acetylase OafA/YrhL
MALTTSTLDAQPPSVRLGYQPALDGVRGVAISLVVLYHYPWSLRNLSDVAANRVHGGFLGVDAFFVLSGFLITTLLLQEHKAFRRVSLRRFYARRALRLLPALGVLLLIALYLHFAHGTRGSDRPQTTGLLGVLFYVANWVNIYRPKALGVTADTWSLAIEEQFYVLWPMILILLLRRRLHLRTIAALTAAGIAASAGWRAYYWHVHSGKSSANPFYAYAHWRQYVDVWNRIYFGSDTRADALLAGCLTAILLVWLLPQSSPRTRIWLGRTSVIALAISTAIITHATVFESRWLPEWGFLAFATGIAVLIAGLVAVPHGLLARMFALPPLAWLGRRSYAIYLFHQLVFMEAKSTSVRHLSPTERFAFQMVAILVAAELSYRLIEAPMLHQKRHFEPRAASPSSSSAFSP